jgi:hypothetical protein
MNEKLDLLKKKVEEIRTPVITRIAGYKKVLLKTEEGYDFELAIDESTDKYLKLLQDKILSIEENMAKNIDYSKDVADIADLIFVSKGSRPPIGPQLSEYTVLLDNNEEAKKLQPLCQRFFDELSEAEVPSSDINNRLEVVELMKLAEKSVVKLLDRARDINDEKVTLINKKDRKDFMLKVTSFKASLSGANKDIDVNDMSLKDLKDAIKLFKEGMSKHKDIISKDPALRTAYNSLVGFLNSLLHVKFEKYSTMQDDVAQVEELDTKLNSSPKM